MSVVHAGARRRDDIAAVDDADAGAAHSSLEPTLFPKLRVYFADFPYPLYSTD